MQNNRRGELKAEYSRLQNQRPANQPNNIRRSAPQNTVRGVNQSPARMRAPGQPSDNSGAVNRARSTGNVRVRSLKPQQPTGRSPSQQINRVPLQPDRTRRTGKAKRPKDHTKLYDFLLGLAIGFIVFGTAAIFVCRALIDIFAQL